MSLIKTKTLLLCSFLYVLFHNRYMVGLVMMYDLGFHLCFTLSEKVLYCLNVCVCRPNYLDCFSAWLLTKVVTFSIGSKSPKPVLAWQCLCTQSKLYKDVVLSSDWKRTEQDLDFKLTLDDELYANCTSGLLT